MKITFYEQARKTEAKPLPGIKVWEQFKKAFSPEEQVKIATQLFRWEWDTDLLGPFPADISTAVAVARIIPVMVGQYQIFKYELKEQGKTDEEIRESVIERIFNAVVRP